MKSFTMEPLSFVACISPHLVQLNFICGYFQSALGCSLMKKYLTQSLHPESMPAGSINACIVEQAILIIERVHNRLLRKLSARWQTHILLDLK